MNTDNFTKDPSFHKKLCLLLEKLRDRMIPKQPGDILELSRKWWNDTSLVFKAVMQNFLVFAKTSVLFVSRWQKHIRNWWILCLVRLMKCYIVFVLWIWQFANIIHVDGSKKLCKVSRLIVLQRSVETNILFIIG